MGYIMEVYVDGGCRRNGHSNAIGAAAAVFRLKWGKSKSWYKNLPRYPPPTNQRAEITAIILALEQALEKYDELDTCPHLNLTVYSDSRYAIGCMTEWIYKWTRNGWINSAGGEVANRDLIEKASRLDDRLREEGDVKYVWIPRSENEEADRLANEAMDRQ